MEKSDKQLIEEFFSGKQKNFDLIVDRYLRQIFNYITRTTGDKNETEDIVQEVFLKVWKNINKFDTSKNFKTWIFTIARNTTIDWLRKRKNIVFSKLDESKDDEDAKTFEESLIDDELLPDEILQKKEAALELEKAVENIRPDFREILILRFKEDLTFQEIAEITGKPLNTVKSHCRRALNNLREILTK